MASILSRQQAALQQNAARQRDRANRERKAREARQKRINTAAARQKNKPLPPSRQQRQDAINAAAKRASDARVIPPFTVDNETLEKYNHTCYLVGGGPSLKGFDWSKLDDKYVVGVNRSYEVLPNSQILYFTDDDWWTQHKDALLKQHTGQLIKGSLNLTRMHHERVAQYHLTGETGWETGLGKLKHGRNSSYAIINMLVQHLGFKKIYLLGLDMKWGTKGKRNTSHWHNGHKRVDAEAVYGIMKKNIATIPTLLKNNGHEDVEIISVNTPEQCDLKTFPMKSFEEVLGS